jgi:hypothetical protein
MRAALVSAAVVVAALLGGCAALSQVDSTVTTFGPWPAQRQPGSYVFERLPSQSAHPEARQLLEDAAHAAIESAGFQESGDPEQAQYLFQIGARVTTNDPWLYNERLFWPTRLGYARVYGPPYGYGRWGRPWGMGGWYAGPIEPEFEREVAVLIRDRHTGELLFEARATNRGPSPSIERLMPAMFQAALSDYPTAQPAAHEVRVMLSAP